MIINRSDLDMQINVITPLIGLSSHSINSENDNILGNNSNPTQPNGPFSELKHLRLKSINRIIISHLNINSIRTKFGEFRELMKNFVEILVISETKIDSSFQQTNF